MYTFSGPSKVVALDVPEYNSRCFHSHSCCTSASESKRLFVVARSGTIAVSGPDKAFISVQRPGS